MKFSWSAYRVASFVDPSADEAKELSPNRFYKLLPASRADGATPCSFTYGVQCKKSALCEVYGMPFCESHGPEAAAVALFEERYKAGETLCDLAGLEMEALRTNGLIAEAIASGRDQVCGEIGDYDRLLEKLPIRHPLDLIDPDSKRRFDEGRTIDEDDPEDEWRMRLWDVVRVMRMAWSDRSYDEVISALEPVRQQAMSQLQIVTRYREIHKEAIYAAHKKAYEKWAR